MFPRVWRGKVTKRRGTRSSCVTPTTNAAKKHPQIFLQKPIEKGSQNHQKRKTKSTSKSKGGTMMNYKHSIHEEERFFTKRLATSHHPTQQLQ
jgi:hypothetical protein